MAIHRVNESSRLESSSTLFNGGTSCALERFGRKELLMVVLCLPSLPILWVVATFRQHGKQDVDYGRSGERDGLRTRSSSSSASVCLSADLPHANAPASTRKKSCRGEVTNCQIYITKCDASEKCALTLVHT
ncbi:hypothetical protein CEXT_586561 [Caerostris extrusa]|uniref:Uncharacterized protein n=1 Tax=Caerostris extrusa TaxID=172846 RepID=A0AAV4RFF4_CAEEX|nr:hypothetical protein CEXT_586561 [Caerostris extrusa]